MKIHKQVAIKPSYTIGLLNVHPRCNIERKASVDLVVGK